MHGTDALGDRGSVLFGGKDAGHKRKQMDMAGERGLKLGKKRRMDVGIRFGAGSLAGELQDYVLAQGIGASDQTALSEWVRKKFIVYLEIQSVFMDCLSELVMFLEGQGFLVEACLKWRRELIWVSMDDILRSVDNLGTNLLKYANREEAVRIATVYEDGKVGIEVRNGIRRQEESILSTKIGVENVKVLMGNMGGRCETEMESDREEKRPGKGLRETWQSGR